MQTKKDEKIPESTTERLEVTLAQLTTDQIRFVVARQEFSKDGEAARECSLSPSTIKGWKYKGVPIDEAVQLMAADGVVVARELRRRNLAKAMAVKVAGLDSDKEGMRQSVSTEIIEWEMGKATQKQEVDVTSKGEQIAGGPSDDEQTRALVSLYEALRDTVLTERGGGQGAVASAEQAPVPGATEPGR